MATSNSHVNTEHLTPDYQVTQSMECSIREIALTQTILTDISVLPVKEITLKSLAQQGRDPCFVSNKIHVFLWPLTLEYEASLSQQVSFSMSSTSTPLCSEISLSAYSQPSDFTHHSPHDIQSSSLNITRYCIRSSLSVIKTLQQTYCLPNIINTMHLLFWHYYHKLLHSNTQYHLLINFHHTYNNSSCSKTCIWFLKLPYMHYFGRWIGNMP